MLSLLTLSRFFLLSSLFSIIVVTHFSIYPFVVGKIIFFRIAIELALLLFLLELTYSRHLHGIRDIGVVFKQPLVLAITFFILIFSLSGFLGYNWQNSFWSNFVRGEGIFQMWHYYAFFILSIFLFRNEKSWHWAIYCFLAAGLLSIILGIIPWTQNYHLDMRFKGAIGNPVFTAVYLIFCLFYVLYFLIKNYKLRISDYKFIKNKMCNWQLVILFLIFLISIFLTGTRGALLGLIVGSLTFLTIFLIKNIKNFWTIFTVTFVRKIIISIIFVSCLLSLVSLFYFQPFRIFQISFREQTAQTRFWTWGSALKGWQERLLLGWGPENFSEVFDKYFDKRHFDLQKNGRTNEVWFDRAHDVFIDYLTTTGILGLLAYLGIWIAYYYQIFTTLQVVNIGNKILFYAFPAVYLIQAGLLFETLPAYISLFLFLGFTNFYLENKNFKNQMLNQSASWRTKNLKSKKFLKFRIWILFVILILGFGFIGYIGSYRPLIKSILFNNALKKVDQINSVEEFKSNFSQALDYWAPYGQQEQLRMLGGLVIDLLNKKPSTEVSMALSDYLSESYLIFGKNNWSAQDYYILAKVNESVGNKEIVKKFYKEGSSKWPARPEFNQL